MNRSRSLPIFLLIAAIAALALIIGLFTDLAVQRQTLTDTQQALDTSMATWQQIVEEKEGLQEELKLLKNDLREADLTLEETATQEEKLTAEIDQLTRDIEALRNSSAQ